MKKFFLLLSLIMLASCTTGYKEVDTKNEQIQAMMFSQNKLYLLGKEQDYQLDTKEEERILNLQSFWKLPLAKKASIEINFFHVYDNHKVHFSYDILINKSELTEQQILLLKDKYYFHNRSDTLIVRYSYDNLYEGEIVKLVNRQELLAKYALPTPLDTEVKYFKIGKVIDHQKVENTAKTIMLLPLMPVIIPVLMALPKYKTR